MLTINEEITNSDTSPYENKDRKLITQPYDMSVQTVITQINDGDIILDPDYQRSYRWHPIKASRFIESLLLNVPIPTVFLAEEEDITYSVIDGQQRLTTLHKFISEKDNPEPLVLEGLQIRSDLNNKKYSDLSKVDRGRLNKQYMRCIVILNDSDPQIKFDVFERLNSGSVQLSEQEIRNCTHRGNFNELIKRLSQNENYLEMLKLPEKDKKNMTDAEYVLRFFSYRDDINNYQGSVKEFLNNFMTKNKNLNPNILEQWTQLFCETVNVIYKIFGVNGFSRFIPEKENWHRSLNRAVFDAEMVGFSLFKFDVDNLPLEEVKEKVIDLMKDEEFIKATASSTNSPEKVRTRITMLKQILKDYGVER